MQQPLGRNGVVRTVDLETRVNEVAGDERKSDCPESADLRFRRQIETQLKVLHVE
jgi:hypothetical protein